MVQRHGRLDVRDYRTYGFSHSIRLGRCARVRVRITVPRYGLYGKGDHPENLINDSTAASSQTRTDSIA